MSTLNIDISNKTIASYVINEPASDIEIVFSGIPDIWQNKNIYSTFVQDNINLTVEVIDYAVKVPESILESGTDFYVGLFAVAYGSNSVVQPTDPILVCVNQPESDGLNMQDLVSAILKINILSKSLATIAFSGNYDDLKNIPIVDQDYNASSERAQSGIAVAQAIAKLVNGSPEALDTLWELANALGNDPNFATTVMDLIGKKAIAKDSYHIVALLSYPGRGFAFQGVDSTGDGSGWTVELYNKKDIDELLNEKVDKVDGYGLVNVSMLGDKIVIGSSNVAYLFYDAAAVDDLLIKKVDTIEYEQFKADLINGDIRVYNSQNSITSDFSATAHTAISDSNHNNIVETYATKEELRPTPLTSITGTLSPNQPYHLSEPPSSIAFPSDVEDGDTIYVTFITGETAPTVTIDTTNTTDIDISIDANTGHEIYGKYVANIGKWIVNYSEYTVTDGEVV